MKKIISTLIIVIFSFSLVSFVLAQPNLVPTTVKKAKEPVPVMIPAHAVAIADDVFSLGEARDVDGRLVQGFMFIDRKNENAKPPWAGGGKGGDTKCYAFLANGAKWRTTEPYITGTGVDLALTETSLNTWDTEVSFNIFGTGATGTTDGADTVSPDDKNEVEFENLGATDTIAYTIVWGIFYGPPSRRELVEWDAVFNSDYAWSLSLSGEAGKMDYQNIATHEFGHAAGMGHPDDSCTEETMYRFASLGETKKRDLNSGDIAGINELYS
ncbi:hypothetical protein A3K63_02290 [Candidatus Micrarchaeota archaeon RBG_16_49_10]|nr:MAG: hypothetical protein A3K63_02290 [Candidatus Micrarchaeota archaeon RBG_16_49_10]